jgi:hypothetical protein
MAFNYSPKIVTDGLVLYLDAANNKSYPGSGTTWTDLSRGGNNGTLTNGPTFNSENGGSIVFDGVDDSSNIPCNFSNLTGLTVNVWYYSNTSNSTALTRTNVNSFILHFKGAGFYLVDSAGAVSNYLGWNPAPAGMKWEMLTGTWDGLTMKLYINGVKQTNELSFTGTGILRSFTDISLGYYFNSFQPWTNGKIANFQLYSRSLSATEVLQNYNATKTRFGLI